MNDDEKIELIFSLHSKCYRRFPAKFIQCFEIGSKYMLDEKIEFLERLCNGGIITKEDDRLLEGYNKNTIYR